jgi:GNAT superfamily N-acetyltransferase
MALHVPIVGRSVDLRLRVVHDMSHVEIVGFDNDLLDQAASLRAAEWGGTPAQNQAYLNWKYLENPYIGDPLVHFAVHEGALVGMRGSMGTCWEISGGRHVVPHGADLLVHPRFRGRGIARKMLSALVTDLRARGFAASISLAAGSMGAPTSVAAGWELVGNLEVVESPAPWWPRGGTSLATRLHGPVARLLPQLDRVKGLLTNPLEHLPDDPARGVRVMRREDSHDLSAIAGMFAATPRMRHVRDADYFAWRLANPLHHYRALATDDAYAVLEWSGWGVHLVDWRATDSASLLRLLTVALPPCGRLRTWETPFDRVLTTSLITLGRVRAVPRRSSSFVVRTISGSSREAKLDGVSLHRRENWVVHMLDSDAY